MSVLTNPRMSIEVYQFGKPLVCYLQSHRRYYYRYCEGRIHRISKNDFLQIVEEYKND